MQDLSKYEKRALPGGVTLTGKSVRIEPLDWDRHGADLAAAICGPERPELWRYMPFTPIADLPELSASMDYGAKMFGWIPMAIVRASDERALGMASYMRLRPEHGSCEVGCIVFGHELQRTRAATEAMYVMARHVFDDLDYRRYEWKCHNDNAASKRAALRFGFAYEGLFRQDLIVKGKNRDTAWFSITDTEWPGVKAGFEAWLAD
ncbi:MAG: N-acetyltransferase, partial [Acidimicrobiales bacterium]